MAFLSLGPVDKGLQLLSLLIAVATVTRRSLPMPSTPSAWPGALRTVASVELVTAQSCS
jgi:hypothetical protein